MSKCTNCFSLEKDKCMLGEKCIHYSKENVDMEISRRAMNKYLRDIPKELRPSEIRKLIEKLRKAIERNPK